MKARRNAPSATARFKRKVSALHTEMVTRIIKDRELDPASLGELLEDMGNQLLDLSEQIRLRILASHRSEERAAPCRPAGGDRH